MMTDILMPPLSQTSDLLVLVSWFKKIGETIKKGEPLFSVETDKATLDIEAPADGVLAEITVQPNTEVKAGTCIGKIKSFDEEGESIVSSDSSSLQKDQPPALQTMSVQKADAPERIFISPRARRLMQEKGVSAALLLGKGSGPMGAIVERDVLAAVQSMPKADSVQKQIASPDKSGLSPAVDVQVFTLSPTRKVIAQRMLESHRNIPAVSYQREVSAAALVDLRQRLVEQLTEDQIRPSLTDFFMAITCRALREFPLLNATFDGEQVRVSSEVHLALAVDTERGLVAPVIFNAHMKGLADLAAARKDISDRARENRLTPQEMEGGTFTLTNLGMLGVDSFTPMINPPQAAILGIGRIRSAPLQEEGGICFQKVINFSLTCDHRIIDGATAARFLAAFAHLVERPELLLY